MYLIVKLNTSSCPEPTLIRYPTILSQTYKPNYCETCLLKLYVTNYQML